LYKIAEKASLVARKEAYSAIMDILIPVLLGIQVFWDGTLYGGNGIWWHTATHGRRSEGERGEWSG